MESTHTEREITDQTMEVDHEKETNADVGEELSIDDLPNEILLMIFRNMNFHQLLGASAVSHRWNELAFFLLQNRVSLRLGRWIFEIPGSAWTRNRTYTRVSCRSTLGIDLDGFDPAALQSLADDVRKLELVSETALDKSLMNFLRFFKAVETLVVKIDQLMCVQTPLWFQRNTQRLLPSIRDLTLRCRYVRVAELLAEVSPKLVTLDLELLPRLLPNFFGCRFDCLESLTLRFKLARVSRLWQFPSKQKLIDCLLQVKTLRKLSFFVDSDCTAFEVAFALTTIEELVLGGNFKGWPLTNFSNLSNMTNLRSLTLCTEGERLSIVGLTTPLPTIEKLRISGPISLTLSTVITIFPKLKVLTMSTMVISDHEVLAIDGSSWKSSMEELSIQIESIKPDIISSFVCLQQLKRLSLDCHHDVDEVDLTSFNAIANMDSLKELHIQQLHGKMWWKFAVNLSDCNHSCAVFINERPANFYGSAF